MAVPFGMRTVVALPSGLSTNTEVSTEPQWMTPLSSTTGAVQMELLAGWTHFRLPSELTA